MINVTKMQLFVRFFWNLYFFFHIFAYNFCRHVQGGFEVELLDSAYNDTILALSPAICK